MINEANEALALLLANGGMVTISKIDPDQRSLWLTLESLAAEGIVEESHESMTFVSYFVQQDDELF